MLEIPECPHCKANLVGEEIPADIRRYYDSDRWGLAVGISNGDSVMWYECPECRGRIGRDGSPLGGNDAGD